MSEEKPIGRQQVKRNARASILKSFELKGFIGVERSAGAVNYMAIKSNEESQFVIASIYGDRRGVASIWVKDDTLELLKGAGELTPTEDRIVQDVSFFKRGMDWKIEIHDAEDALIGAIVSRSQQVMTAIQEEEDAKVAARVEKQRLADERKAYMDSKRKSAF